ncbi:MAG TPA: enterochelin esterase domain-containing protein, partial [Planctomycetota bacterium]|nr:enterochelin esterase domain-containing protein [Planctomycetota bacterium]
MPRTPALFFLAMVALLLAPLPHGAAQSARRASSEKPDLPEGIRAGYRTLSQAMRDEDLAALMGLFHRNFIFEEEDSSTLDRGPWRRRWAELFDRYHFSRAAFEPTGILRQEEGRMVVRTRSVVVRDEERKDVTDLRETYLEDTWVEDDGSWTLIYRREPEVVTQGVVADGDARGGRASPRIARLRKSLATGEEGAIERFIGEVEAAGGILVETVESDAETRLVTFVFRGEGAERRVSVRGGRSTSTDVKELQQLGDTGVWYRTERVPARSRFTYEYVIDKAVTLAPSGGEPAETFIARLTSPDPLNPR